MQHPPRPWRPLGDADLRAARQHIGTALEGFSRRWFAQLRLVPGDAARHAPGATLPEGLLHAGVLGVGATAQAFTDLAHQALDLPALRGASQSASISSALVNGFAQRVRDDLMAVLRANCAVEGDEMPEWRGGAVRVPVDAGAGRRSGLELWCPVAALMCWASRSPTAAAPVALERRELALFDTGVRVEALVGRVRLPATHLVELEPGDVLVLDQPLADPCQLRDAGSHRPMARGRLCRSDGRFGVELHPL